MEDALLQRIVRTIEQDYPQLAQRYQIRRASGTTLMPLNNVVIDSVQLLDSKIQQAMFADDDMPSPLPVRVRGRLSRNAVFMDVMLQRVPYPMVVTASTGVQRGQILRASDLQLTPVAFDKVKPSMARDIDEVVGMQLSRSVRPGGFVQRQIVGTPVLIERGEVIEVRVRGGGITITTQGKALQDGRGDEVVEVEISNTRKRVFARVAAQGVCEIATRTPTVR